MVPCVYCVYSVLACCVTLTCGFCSLSGFSHSAPADHDHYKYTSNIQIKVFKVTQYYLVIYTDGTSGT